jgi:hypothetical protein
MINSSKVYLSEGVENIILYYQITSVRNDNAFS